MQIARLKLKFRNQIRKKEVEAYKQGLRDYFLKELSFPKELSMDCETIFDRHESPYSSFELDKLEEIITDF